MLKNNRVALANHAEKERPKMMGIFRNVLVVLLVCGFCYDFRGLRRTGRWAARVYCVVLLALVAIANLFCCEVHESTNIWSFIEFTLSVLIILFSKNKVGEFFRKFDSLDTTLRICDRYYSFIRWMFLICIFLIWFLRLTFTGSYCYFFPCYTNAGFYMIQLFSLISLDLNRVWRFILFDVIRYRLRILRMRLEDRSPEDIFLYLSNRNVLKHNKVTVLFETYRTIADSVNLISPEVNASFLVSIVCCVPKLILNVYRILHITKEHVSTSDEIPVITVGFILLHLTQIGIFLVSPCAIVELYAAEVEKIRLALVHLLVTERDESTKSTINLFLTYTEIRPFKYTIWRMIPINLGLPLGLLSMCTTYVIVLIQFSHLYE